MVVTVVNTFNDALHATPCEIDKTVIVGGRVVCVSRLNFYDSALNE